MRKYELAVGEIYHIFTKSIAGFRIFNNETEYSRILRVLCYYESHRKTMKFSKYIKRTEKNINDIQSSAKNEKLVDIIAYCIMPTHIHLILKQIKENGISEYMSNVLNSYTRYFNTKYKRKGPLWEGKFKNVLVESDEQLLHLTRYIHLNPVTAYIVNKPEEWGYSSYKEYIAEGKEAICNYKDLINMDLSVYRTFTGNGIDYQRDLAKIKKLILD